MSHHPLPLQRAAYRVSRSATCCLPAARMAAPKARRNSPQPRDFGWLAGRLWCGLPACGPAAWCPLRRHRPKSDLIKPTSKSTAAWEWRFARAGGRRPSAACRRGHARRARPPSDPRDSLPPPRPALHFRIPKSELIRLNPTRIEFYRHIDLAGTGFCRPPATTGGHLESPHRYALILHRFEVDPTKSQKSDQIRPLPDSLRSSDRAR